MRHLLPIALGAALLASCTSPIGGSADASSAFVLAESTSPDGVRTKLRIQGERDRGAALLRVETRQEEVAFVGVTCRALNRAYAESLGLQPWRGVRITDVVGGSGAEAAGLQVGDVLLSLGGQELPSLEAFYETVALLLEPGVPTDAVRLRRTAQGTYLEETLTVTPGARTIEDSTTERVELETPETILVRTGMQVATLPVEVADQCGLGTAPVALVTAVVDGSDAYDEGIRASDRIVSCNGQPVTTAGEVLQAVTTTDELDLVVTGPLGDHRATVPTDGDIDDRSRFRIPIVVDHSSRVDRTRTSFLDVIFQFGFNYSRYVRDADTREPDVKTRLSILPLGMFEFVREPGYSRNRIFWFITWSTRD